VRLSSVSIVILKVALAPCLILLASLAGRRWGPGVGGWVTGLPLTSGPVSLLLALEHGPDFATRAALGTLFGVVSHTAFCVAYSRVAGPVNWPTSVAAGSGAFLASTLGFKDVAVPVPVAFVFLCLVLAAGVVAMPRPARRARPSRSPLGLTTAASTLGPALSGILSPFPILTTILAVFAHRADGAPGAAGTLRGAVIGSFAFARFFLVVGGLLGQLGVAWTYLLASLSALGIHGLALVLVRRLA
jgi:hypothetical protein